MNGYAGQCESIGCPRLGAMRAIPGVSTSGDACTEAVVLCRLCYDATKPETFRGREVANDGR